MGYTWTWVTSCEGHCLKTLLSLQPQIHKAPRAVPLLLEAILLFREMHYGRTRSKSRVWTPLSSFLASTTVLFVWLWGENRFLLSEVWFSWRTCQDGVVKPSAKSFHLGSFAPTTWFDIPARNTGNRKEFSNQMFVCVPAEEPAAAEVWDDSHADTVGRRWCIPGALWWSTGQFSCLYAVSQGTGFSIGMNIGSCICQNLLVLPREVKTTAGIVPQPEAFSSVNSGSLLSPS